MHTKLFVSIDTTLMPDKAETNTFFHSLSISKQLSCVMCSIMADVIEMHDQCQQVIHGATYTNTLRCDLYYSCMIRSGVHDSTVSDSR